MSQTIESIQFKRRGAAIVPIRTVACAPQHRAALGMMVQRLPASLTPLDVALAALLHGLEPVASIGLPLTQALGCVGADTPPPGAFPLRDIAIADGWALRAQRLICVIFRPWWNRFATSLR